MLSKRLHVLLDEPRLARLQAHAADRGQSIGALVRDAIDDILETSDPRLASAQAFLATPPVRIGDPDELDRILEGEPEAR